MSRVFDAECVANVVQIEGKPVTPVTILSEGVKSSTGVALMQGDKIHYITSNATDIKDLITNILNVIDQIKLCLTGLDAVTVSPGSNAAAIALVTTLEAALTTQKEMLK